MHQPRRKPEVVAPAGDREKLLNALAYGADAVYLAGEHFSLRANSANFDLADLAAAVTLAHEAGVRVYVTVNIYAHNEDIEELAPYLRQLQEIGPDALIVSDFGIFALAREVAPTLPIHISTQTNTLNWRAVEAYRALGASRVVLGRELTLAEIATIAQRSPLPLEFFVHGGLCIAYSGRCLLSNYLSGRDSNRGACNLPCRWRYRLEEEQRPGEYLTIEEDARGSYIMNSKDLNLLARLPELAEAGVSAFKIEGRAKSAYYVATVTKVYRQAVDALWDGGNAFREQLPTWQEELKKVHHRHYCEGFFDGPPTAASQNYETSAEYCTHDFVAVVRGYDAKRQLIELEQRNRFAVGERVEFLLPQGANREEKITAIYDAEGAPLTAAIHPQMTAFIPATEPLPPLSIMRRRRHDH